MSNIFDEMADALAEAGQTVGDKIKEARDVTALKAKLRSHQKNVDDTYNRIGKEYFSKHKDDEENEFSDEIAKIKAEQKEIEELKKCISDLKS
jgi:hypothetical protein